MKNLRNSHKISIFVRALAQHSLNSRNKIIIYINGVNPFGRECSYSLPNGFFCL